MTNKKLPIDLKERETVLWHAHATSVYLFRLMAQHFILGALVWYLVLYFWHVADYFFSGYSPDIGNAIVTNYLLFLSGILPFWFLVYFLHYKVLNKKIFYILTQERLVITKIFPFFFSSEDIFLDRVDNIYRARAFGFGPATKLVLDKKIIELDAKDARQLYNLITEKNSAIRKVTYLHEPQAKTCT